MSRSRRGGNKTRQNNKRPGHVDVWRNPGPLPDIEPIPAPSEPAALLRSLGEPPMIDGAAAAEVFTNVVERAAAIAVALAFSADVLADADLD